MRQYQSIVILTGAGVSAESGIQTFRGAQGLWEGHSVEEVATPEGFERNPKLVLDFYNQRRAQLVSGDIQPNAAHIALADLAKVYGDKLMLVTQNVDNLHERGGSESTLHMHGELLRYYCHWCNYNSVCTTDLRIDDTCTQCARTGGLRPDIVWFGEIPKYMDEIGDALTKADLFIAIGTSGNVYPAAGFHQLAKASGATTVEVNLESTGSSGLFDRQILGPATETVPVLVDELIG